MIKECQNEDHKWRTLYYRKSINGQSHWFTPKNKLICIKCEKIVNISDVHNTTKREE